MVHTVLAAGECTVAAASFLIPETKLVEIIDAAGSLQSAENEAATIGAGSSIGRLISDLRTLHGGFSKAAIISTFKDAHSAAELIDDIWNLVQSFPTGDALKIGTALLDVVGLSSCVSLIQDVIGASPTDDGTQPGAPRDACTGAALADTAKRYLIAHHMSTVGWSLSAQFCVSGWAAASVGTSEGGGFGETLLFRSSASGWKEVAASNVIVAGEAGLPDAVYQHLSAGLATAHSRSLEEIPF